MKELIIKLSDREVYAICNAGIREVSRRKQFGTFGLCDKIRKQMFEQITKEEVDALHTEWRSFKSELPATEPKKERPKKIAPPIVAPKKQGKMVIGEF